MQRISCVLASLMVAGCTGEIAGTEAPAGDQTVGGAPASHPSPGRGTGGATGSGTGGATQQPPGADPTRPVAACGAGSKLPASPMRRLTRTEYNNTVRDLLFVNSKPATSVFDEDEKFGGFYANSIAPMTRSGAEAYMSLAESLAANVDLSKLVTCDPAQGGEAACARTFITSFGKRAYRRTLDEGDIGRLMTVFTAGRMGADFQAGIRLVITAALQAPGFMYRPEASVADKIDASTVALSGFELASRLSYFIWSSMPDDALLALAESGAIAKTATLESEVRRMLADPRASDTFSSFARQWLGVRGIPDKDLKLFPDFNDALWASMGGEVDALTDYVFRQGEGKLTTWLTAPFSFVDPALAKLYALPTPKTKTFDKTAMPANQRSGVITTAAMLTMRAFPGEGSPIQRGKFVRESLFCQTPPPPPPGVNVTAPARDPNKSTKQRFDAHRTDPTCATCHELMDPLGYAFMNYDAIGRWQTMDGNFPVDAKGEIKGTVSSNGAYDGAIDLGHKLADSGEVQRCVSRQWLQFSLGRPDEDGDSCAVDELTKKFVGANQDMRELLVAVATSSSFRYRRISN